MAIAPCLDQLGRHAFDDVDGDRETNPLVAAGLRQDGRVDADDLTRPVEQRTPRVAGVDRGVGLNGAAQQVDLVAGYGRLLARIAPRTDDAFGDRLLQAQRRADSNRRLADGDLVRVAQCNRLDSVADRSAV